MPADQDPAGRESFERLERFPMEGRGPLALAGALLRGPGTLIQDLGAGRHLGRHAAGLFVITAGLGAAYGAVLGLYQPGWQTVLAAIKVPLIILASALLCTPTLHVFNAILGSRLTVAQTAALVLLMAAALSMILLAFAPVVWFFGVSTGSFWFMTLLHVAVFLLAAGFGLKMLGTARAYLRHLEGDELLSGSLLGLWSLLLLLVGFQMAHYFRPLLLPGPFHLGERGFFIEFLLGGG